jgi:hypothetical protein
MERILLAKWLSVAAILWALDISKKAWKGPRLCPRAPLLKIPPIPSEPAFYSAVQLCLCLAALLPDGRLPALAYAGLSLWFCATDWTRFRPWFYQNSSLLLLLLFAPQPLDMCRLITISIYFWSGILKINRVFVSLVFPYITGGRIKLPLWTGYLIPPLEAALGLGLLFPASRPWAILGATLMHLFILACFCGPGHKTHREIWPWNVAMLLNNFALFAFTPQVGPWQILGSHPLILAVFALLPSLGLYNRLDPVFSHGHMAGRHCFGSLTLTRRLYLKLPPEIQAHCLQRPGRTRGQIYLLEISSWWMADLGVPAPQQEPMLMAIARHFRQYGAADSDLNLIVFRMPGMRDATYPQHVYAWSELSG